MAITTGRVCLINQLCYFDNISPGDFSQVGQVNKRQPPSPGVPTVELIIFGESRADRANYGEG